MKPSGTAWAKWIAGAAALAFSLVVAAIALRPPPPAPEPDAVPEPPNAQPEVAPDESGEAMPDLPTGQPMALHEAIFEDQDDGSTVLRLRFVAPRIGEGAGRVGYAEASADMEFLCQEVGVPVIEQAGRDVSAIVVSLSESQTVFGQSYPEITQFFESYGVRNGACIWEEY